LDVLPESADSLESISHFEGKFITKYMANVVDKIRVFDMGTPAKHIQDIELPGIGVLGDL
jgi:hypothetical protein